MTVERQVGERLSKKGNFIVAILAIRNDPDHGIYHNGNDHKQGPLSNCPRCAVDALARQLAEAERALTVLAQYETIATPCDDRLCWDCRSAKIARAALNSPDPPASPAEGSEAATEAKGERG